MYLGEEKKSAVQAAGRLEGFEDLVSELGRFDGFNGRRGAEDEVHELVGQQHVEADFEPTVGQGGNALGRVYRLGLEVVGLHRVAVEHHVPGFRVQFRDADAVGEEPVRVEFRSDLEGLVCALCGLEPVEPEGEDVLTFWGPGDEVPSVAVLLAEVGVDAVGFCLRRAKFPVKQRDLTAFADRLEEQL